MDNIQKQHGGPLSKDPSKRCTGISKRSGKRCKKAAIIGGTVCRMHGGGAPQVRAKARERLDELILPAIGILNKSIRKAEKRGDLDSIKVAQKAAQMVLDRTGFGSKQEIELSGNVGVEPSIDLSTFPLWLRMLMAIYSSGIPIPPELEEDITEVIIGHNSEIETLFFSSTPLLGEPIREEKVIPAIEAEYNYDYDEEEGEGGEEEEDDTPHFGLNGNGNGKGNGNGNGNGNGRSNNGKRRSSRLTSNDTVNPDEL